MRGLSVLVAAGVTAALVWGLTLPLGGVFTPGPLLDPWNGLYRTARLATPHASEDLFLDGMDAPVRVEMDERGVPHLFASSDKDATMALGYVVARDRLFEMDFIWRVATGRLAEVFGASALPRDRYFRDIGMVRTVRTLSARSDSSDGVQDTAMRWYAAGANAWVDGLSPADDPFEFRLLGYRPARITAEHALSLFAFMAYDLSFRSSDGAYERTRQNLGQAAYDLLYPEYSAHEPYIVPDGVMDWMGPRVSDDPVPVAARYPAVGEMDAPLPGDIGEGFQPGKGSNNWAVQGARSVTGMPILAGDMHLYLSLPAIWYEVHLVTPDMNVYGVTFPSAPVVVEGITEQFAWAFTNTGSDQVDRYAMELDETGTRYRYDDAWLPLETVIDTIRVRDGADVVHSTSWSHLGPVPETQGTPVAIQWVGHTEGRTLEALWFMNRATDHASFEEATRRWDYPMQNILYAGRDSVIAIRSTGFLPIRGAGDANGILDGTTSATAWQGRVPFEELPAWTNPEREYLTSTNQRPAGPSYPYYLGRDWEPIHRSQRIDRLLRESPRHGVEQLKAYQADVHAVQADYLVPVLDTLTGLSESAVRHVEALRAWDRSMSVDSPEATLFAMFVDSLMARVWDEPVFDRAPIPSFVRLFDAHAAAPVWFDRVGTPAVESFADVLRETLDAMPAPGSLPAWGEVHTLTLSHITRSEALKPLWRERYPYPGWDQTLSPARNMTATHSASWRVVVDLSTSPPTAWGVYPGGQAGNPFSRHYNAHTETFLAFDYFPLQLPRTPSALRTHD